jgi:hypothetical protein
MRWILGVLILGLLLAPTVSAQDVPEPLVNLAHLRHLTEPVVIDGEDMAIVHIYAEYPDYEWVDDADEGISAVDDVARAAIVYLWEYTRTGDESLLDWARRCLNFVMYMQLDDGQFYNFVWDREGTINRTGGTSVASLGWWAMRALWALGEGVRVFDTVEPAYADQLAAAFQRTEAALQQRLGNYGDTFSLHGFDIPAWIPSSESTIASIGLLGLAAYYEARPNETTGIILSQIADGVAAYRLGTDSEYPFGVHPTRATAPGFWHNWGAHMPHALVEAGRVMGRPDWIESAAASANSFLLRHLVFEPFRHMGVIPNRLEQIAYGTNMLVQAYAALYQVTGETRYAELAGLAGSWFFGNNMAGVQMYFPETGRTFDGINGPVSWRVNRNSGAESTIEGLMSMSVLAALPEALPFLQAESVSGQSYRVFEAEAGDRVVGTPVYFSGNWTGEGYISAGRYVGLGEGQRMRLQFELEPEAAGDYLLYVAHVLQGTESGSFTIPYTDAPPVIDGAADDWPADAATLASDTARQFLRGAGLWQGPEVDSHRLRLAWDDAGLYLLVEVRDPEHVQDFTLSNVWQGDSLWLYFTVSPESRALDSKFTLSETPDGPQIWDWKRTGFAEGGQLVWQPAEPGGYAYEAFLPWETIGFEETPGPGARLGVEAGRGFGGSAFMDLTGRDPDIAANLLQMTLVQGDLGAEAAETPEVALGVRLNREDTVIIPQSVSPDSDFFWLDLVTAAPVRLEAGEHTIRYEYAGEEGSAAPGLSKVDAFYLQPAVGQRTFALPDGRQFMLTYDTLTGASSWGAQP